MPKKKKNKKMYFDQDVQDAIVRYNDLDPDKDQVKRNKIYSEEIHYAFDKLCENIINTFKFEYFDDVYIDVKQEVLSFLVMNMHKYDHTKGSKAFSYFSVVCKNYLILHNNANYKRYKTHTDVSVLQYKASNVNARKSYFEDFTIGMNDTTGSFLNTCGYRIFVRGTLTIESGCGIYCTGSDASARTNPGNGGYGATLSAGTDGVNGGLGGDGAAGAEDGGPGGSSGGTGGILFIAARNIVNNGTISVEGGDGAAGQ